MSKRYILVALTLATCPLWSCGETPVNRGRLTVKGAREKPNAATLLKHLGLPIPAATVEHFDQQHGLDITSRLIMVMSDADWATMRASPPFDAIPPGRWDHMQAVLLSSDDGDWQPSTDPTIIAAQTRLPNAEFVSIGYSPAGVGRTRVYLLWGRN